MDSLSFSKSDLKILFTLSMTIPLMSFIFGFFMAQKFETVPSANPPLLTSEAVQQVQASSPSEADTRTQSKTTPSTSQIDITSAPGEMDTIIVTKLAPSTSKKPATTPSTSIEASKTPATSSVVNNENRSDIKRYIVQAGLFSTVENAKKLTQTLMKSGLTPHIASESKNGESDAPRFRVFIDSFESKREAWSYSQKIKKSHSINLFVTDTRSTNLKDLIAAR